MLPNSMSFIARSRTTLCGLRLTRLIAATAAIAITASLAGCVAVGGTVHRAPDPTLGQQLIDLKKAEEQGALTTEEFTRLRADLVARSLPTTTTQ